MTGIYWYISRQKVDALRQAYASSGFDWLKNVSLKLKSPFGEASADVSLKRSLYQDVERTAVHLLKAPETRSFPNLSDEAQATFFYFAGRARRCVDAGSYWIALFADTTALLLAGSVSNAIGAPEKISQNAISPSVDPIRAVQLAFAEKRLPEENQTVSSSCSYLWQTISNPVRANWQTLPEVEGIAVYGGTFQASKPQFDDGSFSTIDKIVIGSPIYVRQK